MEENVYEVPDVKVFIDSNTCPYSVRMRENTDQNNSKYGHFSGRVSNLNFKISVFTLGPANYHYIYTNIKNLQECLCLM